jgi:ketosteroid isomerase-like protein
LFFSLSLGPLRKGRAFLREVRKIGNHLTLTGVYNSKIRLRSKLNSKELLMKTWLTGFGLVICISLLAFGRPSARPTTANMGQDDFRKLEQAWLDAASVPDLPALRKMFADDFMGTSFGGGVLSKSDVVPEDGVTSTHMPKCVLKDSTVRIFGDTAVLMGEVQMQVPQKAEDIRMTTVFQKHANDWQIIAVHMSKAPEGQ